MQLRWGRLAEQRVQIGVDGQPTGGGPGFQTIPIGVGGFEQAGWVRKFAAHDHAAQVVVPGGAVGQLERFGKHGHATRLDAAVGQP